MKENAKYLKKNEKCQELEHKLDLLQKMTEKMKADKEKLLDQYSKMDRDIGASTVMSMNKTFDDNQTYDQESDHPEQVSEKPDQESEHLPEDSEDEEQEKDNQDSENSDNETENKDNKKSGKPGEIEL